MGTHQKGKKVYTPDFTKLKDIHGRRVPHGKRAEATAEYLEKTQWTNTNDTAEKVNPTKVLRGFLNIDVGEIQDPELGAVIKGFEKTKHQDQTVR